MSVFEEAIAAIREKGWTTGVIQDSGGQLCVIGAICFANHGIVESKLAYNTGAKEISALVEVIVEDNPRMLVDNIYKCVWRWNDILAKDADDVIHMLKRAEEILEEK